MGGTRRAVWGALFLFFVCPIREGLCESGAPAGFAVTDAKLALEVDEDRRPLQITSEFPVGTGQVYCWFAWRDAPRGLQLTARWHYITEDLHVLDFPIALTRLSGNGVTSLQMPTGQPLPSGSYRLDLVVGDNVVKSLVFTVLPTPEIPRSAAARDAP